jgi:hypothetical protein
MSAVPRSDLGYAYRRRTVVIILQLKRHDKTGGSGQGGFALQIEYLMEPDDPGMDPAFLPFGPQPDRDREADEARI